MKRANKTRHCGVSELMGQLIEGRFILLESPQRTFHAQLPEEAARRCS